MYELIMDQYQPQYKNNGQLPYQQTALAKETADAKPKKMPGKRALILGLKSIILYAILFNSSLIWIAWIISIIGVACSIKSLRYKPRGFSIAGLILSAFPIASYVAIWLITDMIPSFI